MCEPVWAQAELVEQETQLHHGLQKTELTSLFSNSPEASSLGRRGGFALGSLSDPGIYFLPLYSLASYL